MKQKLIRKGQTGLSTLDLKFETPNLIQPPVQLNGFQTLTDNITPKLSMPQNNFGNFNLGNTAKVAAINYLGNTVSNKILGNLSDTELGRNLGTLFSSGISSTTNTITNNLLKGDILTKGLSQNVGTSLAGAGSGILANYIGQGINALGGNSKLSRGIGAGVSTGLGTVGGTVLGNLASTGSVLGKSSALFGSTANVVDKAGNITKYGAAINPYALGATVLGSALGAGLGPSKEYGGTYGNVTKTMDTIYDAVSAGVNFIPGVGQGISAAMVLNKGLSNLFGSTDGMTSTDAILGSAFMPAPVKWLNMWGSQKTKTFNNQSWKNTEKANTFMQNAFGDLNDNFEKARKESGKTYGTFSQGARKKADKNIAFSNVAWNKIMDMADQNEIQNIRSQYMSSINNQRYAQMIQGGFQPLAIGKQGMKIFNNATNHNIGMRLLSGAALIDNKQMILCSVVD